jgi:hypothetical protein
VSESVSRSLALARGCASAPPEPPPEIPARARVWRLAAVVALVGGMAGSVDLASAQTRRATLEEAFAPALELARARVADARAWASRAFSFLHDAPVPPPTAPSSAEQSPPTRVRAQGTPSALPENPIAPEEAPLARESTESAVPGIQAENPYAESPWVVTGVIDQRPVAALRAPRRALDADPYGEGGNASSAASPSSPTTSSLTPAHRAPAVELDDPYL